MTEVPQLYPSFMVVLPIMHLGAIFSTKIFILVSIVSSVHMTHWGRVMHMCIINGLLPNWRRAIIWTNAGILLIGPLAINVSEILIEIHTFSFRKMDFKMLSAKWRPFCLGVNVLRNANFVITAPADYLAPNNVRSLAGPVPTTN